MQSVPVPDPFQLALEAERINAEDTVSNYLSTHAGQGPNIDLFLKIYNPQTQLLHERLGLSRLIGLFQHRLYWNRRARMLLGDHVPYSEGVPNELDTSMFELVYDNYVTVMTQTVEGFASIEPGSAESAVARSDLTTWIESTRLNVTATIRELIDIVLLEQRLDPNNAGQTTAPPDPIGDIFASCLAESQPVIPPDRTPMLELAALACAQELAVRLSLDPKQRARPSTPQVRTTPANFTHRGRSRRVIEDDDEELLLPTSRPVRGHSREWVIVDETIDESMPNTPPPQYPSVPIRVPRLGYGSEDRNCPFLLP